MTRKDGAIFLTITWHGFPVGRFQTFETVRPSSQSNRDAFYVIEKEIGKGAYGVAYICKTKVCMLWVNEWSA